MAYTVGQSGVANWANTSSGKVTRVVANNGLGGSSVITNVISRPTASLIISANIQNALINVSTLSGYVAGQTDITITVNSGVYVYGSCPIQPNTVVSTAPIGAPVASMEIIGGASGDKINIINNGYILGYGGDGAGLTSYYLSCTASSTYNAPTKGGAAIATTFPINSIINNGYIAGGGGGGGTSAVTDDNGAAGGGGGAGGGIGMNAGSPQTRIAPPTTTGNIGAILSLGYGCCAVFRFMGGGGGGFGLPGTGGTVGTIGTFFNAGVGGSAGGSGGVSGTIGVVTQNYGGSANGNAGPSVDLIGNEVYGGGGGGWAANGGNGTFANGLRQVGAVGGYAIVTNGNSVSAPTGSGTVWGTTYTSSTSVVYTFPSTSNYQTLNLDTIPGIAAGMDVILVVPANVILYSSNYLNPALKITYSTYTPNSVRIIVNGAIMGAGGIGGGGTDLNYPGGDAIGLGATGLPFTCPIIFDCTNGYIAGGGGGGGKSATNLTSLSLYGGGGAGGGSSGSSGSTAYNPGPTLGTYSNGNNGYATTGTVAYSGGSGGTILPGTITVNTAGTSGTTYPGKAGQAGGAGAFTQNTTGNVNNYGGGFNQNGGQVNTLSAYYAGGGGGWGGAGGSGYRNRTILQAGAVGGGAVRNITASNAQVYIVNSSHIAGTVF